MGVVYKFPVKLPVKFPVKKPRAVQQTTEDIVYMAHTVMKLILVSKRLEQEGRYNDVIDLLDGADLIKNVTLRLHKRIPSEGIPPDRQF